MFADDTEALLYGDDWLECFGVPVCAYVDITKLYFAEWDWTVKRVLFDGNRDVDFSILPVEYIDSVLSVNKEIISKGYQVIYDFNNVV